MARKLTGQEKTFEGYIIDFKPWSSGKGYFLNIDSQAIDFYGFGSCSYEMGNTLKLTVGPGTGQFKDKMEIYKIDLISQTEIHDYKTQNAGQETAKPMPAENYVKRKETQDSIEEQCCMKAAAGIIGRNNQGKPFKTEDDLIKAAKDTILLKKIFHANMKGKEKSQEGEENAEQ